MCTNQTQVLNMAFQRALHVSLSSILMSVHYVPGWIPLSNLSLTWTWWWPSYPNAGHWCGLLLWDIRSVPWCRRRHEKVVAHGSLQKYLMMYQFNLRSIYLLSLLKSHCSLIFCETAANPNTTHREKKSALKSSQDLSTHLTIKVGNICKLILLWPILLN